jgi:hypothetical protein
MISPRLWSRSGNPDSDLMNCVSIASLNRDMPVNQSLTPLELVCFLFEYFSSSLCVQTGYGAHPASCTVGTGGPFHGDNARPRREADHTPPSSAQVKNELELYLLSPLSPSWREVGQL